MNDWHVPTMSLFDGCEVLGPYEDNGLLPAFRGTDTFDIRALYGSQFINCRIRGVECVGRSVTLRVQFQNKRFRFGVHTSLTVNRFVQIVGQRLGIQQATQSLLLVYDGRILTSGTLHDYNIDQMNCVYLVNDRVVQLTFAHHDRHVRTRLFTVNVRTSESVHEMEGKLVSALNNGYPSIDTNNQVIRVSEGNCVLSADSYPLLPPCDRTSDNKEYTVHIFSEREAHLQMQLTFQNDIMETCWKDAIVFVPVNGTIQCLRNEIAKHVSSPSESLKISVSRSDAGMLENDTSSSSHSSDEDDYHLLGLTFCAHLSQNKYRALELPFHARITDYPGIFYDGCLLKVHVEPQFVLTVKITFDDTSEVSMLRLRVYKLTTMKQLSEKVAKKMAADPRLVKMKHTGSPVDPEKTMQDYKMNERKVLCAEILTTGASITVVQSDGLFSDSLFISDTSKASVGMLQAFVEKKHCFHPDSIRLWREGRLLDKDVTLKIVGVGMDDSLTARFKTPSTATSDSSEQEHANTSTTDDDSLMLVPKTRTHVNLSQTLGKKSKPGKSHRSQGSAAFTESAPVKRKRRESDIQDDATSDESTELSRTLSASLDVPPSKQRCRGACNQESDRTEVVTLPLRQVNGHGLGSQDILPVCESKASTDNRENGNEVLLSMSAGANTSQAFNMTIRLTQEQLKHTIETAVCGSYPAAVTPPPTGQALDLTTVGVTKETLAFVARELGFRWETFSSAGLGLAITKIEAIQKRHPQNLELQGLSALQDWKLAQGNQATCAKLQKLLRDNDLTSIAESIQNRT